MSRTWTHRIGIVLLALAMGATMTRTAAAAALGENLTPEGAFDDGQKPTAWEFANFLSPDKSQVARDGDNPYIQFTNDALDKVTGMQRSVELPAGAKFVVVSARMKVSDLKLGKDGWHEPRIVTRFQNDKGEQVGGNPAVPQLRENSDWVTKQVELDVPDGATRLHLQPGLWLCTGTMGLDDLSVVAHPSRLAYVQSKLTQFSPGFPQGTFDEATGDGKPKGWDAPAAARVVDAAESVAVATEDHGESHTPGTRTEPTGKVLAFDAADHNGDKLATMTFAVDPAWQEVRLAFKMKVERHKLGDETQAPRPMRWRQYGAHLTFLGEDGKSLTDGGGVFVQHHRAWTEFMTDVGVPEGAVAAKLDVGLFHAGGKAYFDDVRIVPSNESKLADAELTKDEHKKELAQKPVETITDQRARISLNGLWKFVPAKGETLKEPKGFGYIRVPGAWNRDAVVQRGQGRMWLMFKGDDVAQAWYERTVDVPAEWAGRAVELNLDRVSTDAVVYVNGTEVGQVNWPGGTVDLTSAIKPGEPNQLRIRVLAVDDRTEVTHYMGYVNEPKAQAKLDNRGIIRDVTLISRPKGPHVFDVLMRPSTRQKQINVDLELADVAKAGEVALRAEMLDEQGKVEKTFEQTLPVQAAAMQKVTATWDWADPRLWDVGQPNRYTMRLTLSGAVNDVIAQPFGFREFWIEARKFFLNNTEIRLRPNNLQYGAMPKQYLDRGYNFAELWPDDRGRRGSDTYDDKAIREADVAGVLVGGKAMHMMDWVGDIKKWREDPKVRDDYRRLMELDVRKWRNSPSVVMWAHTANALQSNADGDPWLLGKRDWSVVQEYVDRHQNVQDAIAMIKAVDPSRPVYAHHGTYNGEVYTSNMYLNFIPLQEREEYLSEWARNGQMPFMAVEFGPPLYASVMRGRDGYTHQGNSEPLATEWVARYFGTEAYRTEPADYRKLLHERFKGGNLQHEYDPHIRHGGAENRVAGIPGMLKLFELYAINTWRSWRTIGVTGGMIPWHHDDTNHVPVLKKVNGPSLAWIAGPGSAPLPGKEGLEQQDVFTEKDHSYAAGQKLAKQVALLNDHRQAVQATYDWRAFVGDQQVAAGKSEQPIELKSAETKLLPIEVTLPGQVSGEKVTGRIELTAKVGPDEHKDTFAFEVFAPVQPAQGTLSVFDPVGDTAAMLKALGYTVNPWTDGAASGELVVIGRKALSDKHTIPGGLAEYIRGGGRVIVFGQAPDWTHWALNLRTSPHLARRVFRIDANHPVVAGLDDNDLRDWNGQSRMVEAYPHYPGYEWTYTYGWHWGNRGAVTSTPIEKPHRSSLRPILECEWDVSYSPLLEMDHGRGRLTLCTLDLEDHYESTPAARKLARQVVEHARTAELRPKAENVIYLGDEAGAKLLESMGVRHSRVDALEAGAQLVIVGNGASVRDDQLASFVGGGGRVIVLRRSGAGDGPLGADYEQVKDYYGSTNVPVWPEAAGLSASDLRWRSTWDNVVLKGNDKIEVGADGQLARMAIGRGVVLFAQVSPEAVPADQKRFFRYTRWRQTRALSQVLANMGATFHSDDRLVSLIERPEHVWMLAGEWQAQLTNPKPESKFRQWNADPGVTDLAARLVKPDAATDGFEKVWVPAYMEAYGEKWRWTDGEVVFRKEVNVPEHLAGKDLFLSVGRVDENEITYFNGEQVGKSRSWLWARGHRIPGNLVKAGRNVIAVRVWDEGIHGGMAGSPDQILLRVADGPNVFYHDDYISHEVVEGETEKDWSGRIERQKVGDNPYRYYRW